MNYTDHRELVITRRNGEQCRVIYSTQDAFVGQLKWHISSGYARGGPNNEYMHRLIMRPPKGMQVDHINGNRLDNRRENLRVCTSAQNIRNKGKLCTNTSGYKGVHLCRLTGRWRAEIWVNNKGIKLGRYPTPEAAANAFNAAAKDYHGEFAYLNSVED